MPIADHGLPDEYLREIGRVAVEWSRLEAEIEIAIWTFAFTGGGGASLETHGSGEAAAFNEPQGRAITTHVNLLLRIDMMLTLANVRIANAPQYHQPLVDMARRIREAYPKRNKIVHGIWESTGKAAFRQTYRARGEIAAWFEIVTIETLSETAQEIAALVKDLQSFIADLTELYVVRIPKRLEPNPQDYVHPGRRLRTSADKLRRRPRSSED